MKVGDKIICAKNYSENIWIRKNNTIYQTSKKVNLKKNKTYNIKNIYSVYNINDIIQINNGIELSIEEFKYYFMSIKQIRLNKLKKIKTLWKL